jgi:RNA 3'-terminal phosphate cyclase (ATP)
MTTNQAEGDMIHIDGSQGEGGGQVLRTSLALSLVTGKPFRIERIRAGRKTPGLLRQHLTAVNAAKQIGQAEVTAIKVGTSEFTFIPAEVVPGDYRFAIGTAGSTSLVLQAVLPALLQAVAPTVITLEGGTHNPFAPPFDFLQRAFLPLLNRMGPRVTSELVCPGFYPAGGGTARFTITPTDVLTPLDLSKRGEIRARKAKALVANLPPAIAQRELGIIGNMLSWRDEWLHPEIVQGSCGPGNTVSIEIESEHVTEVFTGFGERGVPAEVVAENAVKEARRYLASEAAVGEYLADQLLVPMALAGGGAFTTGPLSRHAQTNIEVIKKFIDVEISSTLVANRLWQVRISRPM